MLEYLNILRDYIKVESSAKENYFNNFLKKQTEIAELKFISNYYNLKSIEEFEFKLNIICKKFNINLDIKYLNFRWNKFYGKNQNKTFSQGIKNKIYLRDSFKCSYCGYNKRKNKVEIHHVIPQSINGSNSIYNLVCACEKCNRSIGSNILLPNNWCLLHPDSKNNILIS